MNNRAYLLAAVMVSAAACGGGGGGDDSGPTFTTAHPRIFLPASKDRLTAALAAQTPAAMRFQKMVDGELAGRDFYAFPAWNAALMTQLTGDTKYCTFAIAQVDKQVTDANTAISAGNAPDVAGDDFYSAGDDIGDLALTYDWCSAQLTGDQQKSWLAYGQQVVFNIWNPDKASWGGKSTPWSGWAVDDPDDNYYYDFLRATMLFGLAAHDDLPDADQWLTQFHDTKVMDELMPKFDSDLVGGGSREGTSYGVSMRGLFELYDWWKASTGEDLADKTPHTRASLVHFLHTVVPTLDRVAPTGDQARDSTASFFDYHREYLEVLISQYPTDPQAPRAQALLAQSSVPAMTEQFEYVYDFIYENTDVPAGQLDLATRYFGPGTGQLYARSTWDKTATWMNFIAGPYTESHAHQDQTALTIYKDGWLAYDAVIDSHSGLPQDTTAHNVVRLVDGNGKTIPQQNANQDAMVALHVGSGYTYAAADVSSVYNGQKVQREVVYVEPDAFVVYDRVTSTGGTQVWQMAMPQQPTTTGATTTMTASGHTLNIQRLEPATATASTYDYTADSDFMGGFRLDETVTGGDNRFLHVIWIDGAVGTVTAQAEGATLTLSDGSTAQVTFNKDTVGATLVQTPSGGSPATVTLGAGVDTLPE
nr:hypothetical protein [Kofleriaceae bacterium]